MTHSWEKIAGLCYATAKILQRGRKNKVTVELAVGKIAARKNRDTADTPRTHKDAKLHESSWHNQELMIIYANTSVTFIWWL